MAKRGERVAPPPRADEWELVFGTNEAANGWQDLVRQAPGPTREAYESLSKNPLSRTERQHLLHGRYAIGTHKGEDFPQWQYEVTGPGRIWYLVDEKRKRVVIQVASTKHPKATE